MKTRTQNQHGLRHVNPVLHRTPFVSGSGRKRVSPADTPASQASPRDFREEASFRSYVVFEVVPPVFWGQIWIREQDLSHAIRVLNRDRLAFSELAGVVVEFCQSQNVARDLEEIGRAVLHSNR